MNGGQVDGVVITVEKQRPRYVPLNTHVPLQLHAPS